VTQGTDVYSYQFRRSESRIDQFNGRSASLVVDLSGRNITVANDIVSHGNIHSQTLNVTSVQVGTFDGDRIGASEIRCIYDIGSYPFTNTETDQISSQSSARERWTLPETRVSVVF
jgi:hypothetical protein